MSHSNSMDDNTLSAWLDGELPRSEARSVEQAITKDPAMQQRVDALLHNDQAIKAHFRRMTEERPVPEGISALLFQKEDRADGWISRLRDGFLALNRQPVLATAAVAVAAVTGLLAGQFVFDQSETTSPSIDLVVIDPVHDWYPLLEKTPSGQLYQLSGRQVGQVALSYRNGEGLFCRQFEVKMTTTDNAIAAIACRDSGKWQVELAQRVQRTNADSGHFRTASADGLSAVDAFIMQHSSGEILVGASEAAIMAKGW